MNHTKKYLVVPFVKTIESPNESMVNNLDQNMSEIIEDKDLTDDDRMKLYYNNLNKFLLKYDPETHGISPSLTKLAKNVEDFIEKNNESKKTSLEVKDNYDESLNLTKETNNSNYDMLNDNLNTSSVENNEFLKSSPKNLFTPKQSKQKAIFSPKSESPENNVFYSPSTEHILNKYEAKTNPASNLRNSKVASHSEGLEPNINISAKKTPLSLNTLEKVIKLKPARKTSLNTKKQLKTKLMQETGYGSLKNFFSMQKLKNLIFVFFICVLLVMIEICIKYFNPSILERIILKEDNIVDLILNITKQ